MTHPLRAIVSRPDQLHEALECGHTILRPLGLGENAQALSKVQRRRCYKCEPVFASVPSPTRQRGAPAEPRGVCELCGKRGLGNTYHSAGRAYRQCRFCGEPNFK